MKRFISLGCFGLLVLTACRGKQERLLSEYLAAREKDVIAYSAADAAAAYREKLQYLDHVKKLEREGADFISYQDIYVWDFARLGLLAEHLGMKPEAARFFATAAANAQKAYPNRPNMNTEAALRSALEQMDTPDKFAWRRK